MLPHKPQPVMLARAPYQAKLRERLSRTACWQMPVSIPDIKRQTGHDLDAVVGRYIREVDPFETIMPIWSLSPRFVPPSP